MYASVHFIPSLLYSGVHPRGNLIYVHVHHPIHHCISQILIICTIMTLKQTIGTLILTVYTRNCEGICFSVSVRLQSKSGNIPTLILSQDIVAYFEKLDILVSARTTSTASLPLNKVKFPYTYCRLRSCEGTKMCQWSTCDYRAPMLVSPQAGIFTK